jgi:hypothetical protein
VGGFTVDTDLLADLGARFLRIADDVVEVTGAHEVEDRALGGRIVGDALCEFEDHWRSGRQRLHERLRSVGMLVQEAASAYKTVDHAVVEATGRPVGPLVTPPEVLP